MTTGQRRSELLGKGRLPYFDQDEVHEIYRAWRRILDSYPGGRMAVAEAWAETPQRLARYIGPDELHQAFSFDFLDATWSADSFRKVIDTALAEATSSARRPPGCCPTTTSSGTSPGTATARSGCAGPAPPPC